MLERALQTKIVHDLRARGLLVIKLTTLGAYGSQGWPDLLILGAGVARFLEVKAAGKKATQLQEIRIGELRGHGFQVNVVDSFDAYKKLSI